MSMSKMYNKIQGR